MGSKVGCFAGFCHHYLTTMSVQCMCIIILCLKVERKWVCEQSLYAVKTVCYYINTKNNSKIDFSYNDDWYTAGYGEFINGVL